MMSFKIASFGCFPRFTLVLLLTVADPEKMTELYQYRGSRWPTIAWDCVRSSYDKKMAVVGCSKLSQWYYSDWVSAASQKRSDAPRKGTSTALNHHSSGDAVNATGTVAEGKASLISLEFPLTHQDPHEGSHCGLNPKCPGRLMACGLSWIHWDLPLSGGPVTGRWESGASLGVFCYKALLTYFGFVPL